MALLVQLYVVSLRLQHNTQHRKIQQSIGKNQQKISERDQRIHISRRISAGIERISVAGRKDSLTMAAKP